MMTVEIKITPRSEVLDTQGRTLLEVVHQVFNKPSINQCTVGKCILLKFEETDKKKF